jgi:hypothetical protein
MKRMAARCLTAGAIVVLLTGACSPAATKSENPAAAAQATTIALTARPNLSADAQAMPRLDGDGPAHQRINADLDQMDAATLENLTRCASDAGDGPGGGWSQTINRPMVGPAYLTLQQHLDYYCGGAYPSVRFIAVTYDLATGERADWPLLVPGLGLSVSTFDDMPQGYVPLVRSAALGAWYGRRMLASPDPEWVEQCRMAWEDLGGQTFNIWADAESNGVSVEPDFPHVIQACAERATLTLDDLRGFDADPALIEAIATAHAAGNWAPKDAAQAASPAP